MATKPSSRYFIKAIERRAEGYVGQFSAPGLVPATVQEGGAEATFQAPENAELAAGRALVDVLNARATARPKKAGYARMSGEELSAAITTLGVTVAELARIVGVPPARAIGWIDGVQDIPHSVLVIVTLLLASAENRTIAVNATDKAQRGAHET